MTALTTAELTQMRLDAESILDTTCTIQTLSRASDGMGGWPETWANAYTGVACLLSAPQQQPTDDVSGDRFKVVAEWILSVHWDQAIAVNNRVILGGDTFDVVSIHDDQGMRVLRQAGLKRTEG